MMRIERVGVVGYSGAKFDVDKAKILVEAGLSVLSKLSVYPITVVSGLTNIGIPAIAYTCAKDHGWRTVGIACSKATEYDCFPVDEKHIVGDNWGDESDAFLNNIDAFLRVGGGKQSLAEAAAFKARYPHNEIIELELAEIK